MNKFKLYEITNKESNAGLHERIVYINPWVVMILIAICVKLILL
jgi:hypothetical protein